MSDVNPFDELDLELTPQERTALESQPMPGFMERFRANEEQAYYTGTLAGGIKGQGTQALDRDIAVNAYEALPQWETPLDALAAFSGQIWGSLQSPENFTPIGPGAKAVEFAGVKGAPWMARFFAGAIDAGLSNAAVDAVVQGAEIAGGDRQGFDPTQTAVATGLGALIGGGAGTLSKGAGGAEGNQAPAPQAKPAAEIAGVAPAEVPAPVKSSPDANAGLPEGVKTATPEKPAADAVAAEGNQAAAVVEPPALGDVLDAEARTVRGLPARMDAAVADPVIKSDIVGAAAPAAATSPPAELAALSVGPRTGMLGRDVAGVAATAEDIASPVLVRLKDTAETLMKSLDAVAVRMGRIATPKADGIYKTGSGVIRLRKPDDFDVLAHELGHHVEVNIGKPVQDLMTVHAKELEPMAYAGADPKVLLKEGFAEYMRVMVTNPAYAAKQAPVFDAAFRAMLAKGEPDVLKALNTAAAAWKGWLDQPSATAVASTIVSSEQPWIAPKLRRELGKLGLGNTIAERINRFYGYAFDDLHPVNRAVRGLARLAGEKLGKPIDLKVADDAYKLARLARGAYNAGQQDLMHGVAAYGTGQVVSSSLRDALVMAMGKGNALAGWDKVRMQQFGSYLWSRRAMGEWERFEKGLIPNPPDKLTKGDHAQNIADMEKAFPQFKAAAPLVHDFAQALWSKKRDAGLISQEQWEGGMAIKDYVPGLRAFDQEGDAAGVSSGKAAPIKSSQVKRFQGSQRDVLNPLESLMTDAFETANAIARNDVIRALDRVAALAGPGSGAIAERIPSHQMKATTVDVLEALHKAAKENGVADADYIAMRDMVEGQMGDDVKTTLFRPAVINEKGEAIAFFREGGELKALRLADGQFGKDMARALSGMTRSEKQIFDTVSLPLAKAAAVARLGVVADIPFLIKNFIRDQMQAFVFYGKPVKTLAGSFKGMAQEVMGKDIARAYNVYGGIMGGANTATVRDARSNHALNALRKKGWAANRFSSFSGLLEATELSETGMRLNLFQRFTEEAKGRGLSDHEAMLEGAFQARDYIDFDRRGAMVTPITRLVPFLNANLQGLDKFTRQMIVPLFREGVTVAEKAQRAQAAKAWARVSAVMVGTLALHSVMSEDDTYNDIDPELKARNWVFKWNGSYVAIPKPFEVAAFINMGPAIFDGMAKHDPRWTESLKEGARAAFLPPDIVLGNPLVKTVGEAYTGNDLRTGTPIIPQDREGLEPFLQYSSRTSAFSKALGEAINQPPVVIDQLITNFTTSLGRTVLSLSDYATSDKPIGGWDDFVITKSFIKDGSRGASSSRAFYDLVGSRTGTLEGARRTWEDLNNAGDLVAADNFLAQQDETTKSWIAIAGTKPEVRRLHPFTRAKNAVSAISDLRRDIMQPTVQTAKGAVDVSRRDRGAVDDILGKLAMAEARNALVMMGVDGWKGREVMETAGYYRELQEVSPDLAQALADRFATAKVLPLDTVERLWPEVQKRLLRDGGDMLQSDFVARAKAAGFEMDGTAIKRKARRKVEAGALN